MLFLCLLYCACGDSDNKNENEALENTRGACIDGIDNDEDGAVDCEDAECAIFCTDTATEPDAGTDAADSCPWQEPEELPGTPDAVRGGLITFNDDGCWCWYQDERAVVDVAGGKLIVGSVAGQGGRRGAIEAVIYDIATGQSQRETLHDTSDLWMDDHNAPAVLVLENGNYLAMYAGHNHQDNYNSYYRIYSGGQWAPEQIFDWQLEAEADYTTTYSNLWNMSAEGRVYNIARTHDKSPNMMVSEDNGQTWRYLGQLTMSGNVGYVNGYFKYWGNGVDRIDFTGTDAHPRDAQTNLFHGYVEGGKTYNSTGIALDDNIADKTPPPISDFTTVFASGTTLNGIRMTRAWNIDVQRYDDGQVAALLKARANDDDTDHRFIYARFNGTAWNATYLGKAGDKLYCFPEEQYKCEEDYVGLGALDPDDPDVIYLSSPFDLRDDTTQLAYHEIFKGVTCDGGQTFNWSAITANSTADNLRPIVPKWDESHTALLWMKGTYTTAQDIATAVVGVITSVE
jgi:hypothetical protein